MRCGTRHDLILARVCNKETKNNNGFSYAYYGNQGDLKRKKKEKEKKKKAEQCTWHSKMLMVMIPTMAQSKAYIFHTLIRYISGVEKIKMQKCII